MNDINELLATEAEAIEADKDAPLKPGTKITRGHGRSRVLQVRLNSDEYAALEALARARNLPLSTLARSILTATPEGATTAPAKLIERIRHDIDLLSREVA